MAAKTLKIFCDAAFTGKANELLREGIAPHELIRARQASASILAEAAPDPALAEADIAYGQPEPSLVLASQDLRWLHLTSAGYTRYDTPEFRDGARKRGLVVTNSSGVFSESCAQQLFAYMLAQTRQLPESLRTQKEESPRRDRIRGNCQLLRNQKVVILGYGVIAARLIAMLAPFEMEIAALRRTPRSGEGVTMLTEETLASALGSADHVINILPASPETQHFVSAERIAQMKPGAAFYNIGRGGTVDQSALVSALSSGRLAAAWLDVTDPEPLPPDHPLRTLENCFITPHTGGGQENEFEANVRHFLDNLRRFLDGAPLVNRIF